MGSPLSPILADIVMEDLEVQCLKKLDFKMHTYYRYVDDIFLVIPKTKLDSLLNIFNEYHPRLKFTCELENNNSLSFLNVSVIREGGKLITNWYRKPTFSGRYINFFSNHPEQYKMNTINNLVDQAILLSNERFHDTNVEIVKKTLINNCYPIGLINKTIRERRRVIKQNLISRGEKTNENIDNRNKIFLIPYMKDVSSDIKRLVKNCVDVIYSIPKKLDLFIKKGKDRLNVEKNTEIVYKINCMKCDQTYIGQTKRHLDTRIKEHKNNIKNSSGNYSVVTNHRLSFNHDFEWDKPIILHRERNRRCSSSRNSKNRIIV